MLGKLIAQLIAAPWRTRAPQGPGALREAALAQERAGDYDAAQRSLEQAVELDSGRADCWLALGELHMRRGNPRRAAICFAAALDAAPAWDEALRKRAEALRADGRIDEAIMHLRRAREQAPRAEGLLRDLVDTLIQCDNVDMALAVALEAHAQDPESREANMSLALAFQKAHQPDRALSCLEALLSRREDAQALDLRGSARLELGRVDDALRDFERALAVEPQFALAAFHRALALLLLGDFERGWEGYELRRLDTRRSNATPPGVTEWDGSALAGRTLLVTREQGLGDEIMFASILPEIIAEAGRCLVECNPRLRAIFQRSFPGATVFPSAPQGGLPQAISHQRIDFAVPAGSLARHRRARAEAFPRHDGYLKADPKRVDACRERLAQLGPGIKVGLSWTGGVRETRRALRSIPLQKLLPLLHTPGTRFISLQYTASAADDVRALGGGHIEHWQEVIDDYDETAAMVCALDLVVSVCTSLVHLGGALGRPVWVMVPYSPEWRYGARSESMPWYPNVRLFRQPAYGDWDPVIAAVAAALPTTPAASDWSS